VPYASDGQSDGIYPNKNKFAQALKGCHILAMGKAHRKKNLPTLIKP